MTAAPSTADQISTNETKEAWVEAGYQVLREIGSVYNRTITYTDFAAEIQRRSGISNDAPIRQWIGGVLDLIALVNLEKGEPITTALAISASNGEVIYGYKNAAGRLHGEVPSNADNKAAEDRVACYRFFEAKGLPENGGRPTLTPQVARRRKLQAAKAAREEVRAACSTCFLQLPRTGRCDNCD